MVDNGGLPGDLPAGREHGPQLVCGLIDAPGGAFQPCGGRDGMAASDYVVGVAWVRILRAIRSVT